EEALLKTNEPPVFAPVSEPPAAKEQALRGIRGCLSVEGEHVLGPAKDLPSPFGSDLRRDALHEGPIRYREHGWVRFCRTPRRLVHGRLQGRFRHSRKSSSRPRTTPRPRSAHSRNASPITFREDPAPANMATTRSSSVACGVSGTPSSCCAAEKRAWQLRQ